MARIQIIAAHADDEALGCGGTIARHTAMGDEVRVLFMTDGEASRGERSEQAYVRAMASQAACACLGVATPTNLDFPDNAMDTVPLLSIAKSIAAALKDFEPDIVYTHHAQDLNVDHRLTHEAVMTVLRPQPDLKNSTILAFETVSSTEWRSQTSGTAFIPNWYQDISEYLDRKLEALVIYEMEMRAWPHARSLKAVEHLARWRGASIGRQAAEAFQLVRSVK